MRYLESTYDIFPDEIRVVGFCDGCKMFNFCPLGIVVDSYNCELVFIGRGMQGADKVNTLLGEGPGTHYSYQVL